MTRQIYSKLLLFGEYAILEGGNALSLNNKNMWGNLALDAEGKIQIKSHENLKLLAQFLETHFYEYFDFNKIFRDLGNGLYFESNIPQGYGVGSSGAVLAAFLHQFGKFLPNNLGEKQRLFATMENFFHGKSSGLDVLVCYENACICIENKTLHIEDISENNLLAKFNLIDSKEIGITSHLVKTFKKQPTSFREIFLKDYVSASNACIKHFLANEEAELFASMKELSAFTYTKMPWTIPSNFKPKWKESLHNKNEVLKLCGSGGGGYVICYNLAD